MLQISLIAALSLNHAIGRNLELLWRLPDDFKWFKKHTLGKPIIMGRMTMESLGKPLPGRQNFVISRSKDRVKEGFIWVDSLDQGIEEAKKIEADEIFIIGGGIIYAEALPYASRLYLTHVLSNFEDADAFFPEFDRSRWNLTYREHHLVDDRHDYAFDMCIYQRKK